MNVCLIAIGGSLGALCRYLIHTYLQKSSNQFPYGTFVVNMLGTLLLGWLVGKQIEQTWMLFLGTGFCGALTTFSTLHWEILQLKQRKQTRTMMLYTLLTYSLGIVMAIIGYGMGSTFHV